MKERPILFSAPMVRAILEGRKTQTRRALNPQPVGGIKYHPCAPYSVLNGNGDSLICKFGNAGDRLWVRETWRGIVQINSPWESYETGVARYIPDREHCIRIEYAATQSLDSDPWRPSIHMPRWASRIDLEITGIRVERLQDISEQDAMAEGVDGEKEAAESGATWYCKPKKAYRFLWQSINGPESWDKNPWVWVIEFKRVGQ